MFDFNMALIQVYKNRLFSFIFNLLFDVASNFKVFMNKKIKMVVLINDMNTNYW